MKVQVTFDFDGDAREAINARFGQEGWASRATCAAWVASTVDADLENVIAEHFGYAGEGDSDE